MATSLYSPFGAWASNPSGAYGMAAATAHKPYVAPPIPGLTPIVSSPNGTKLNDNYGITSSGNILIYQDAAGKYYAATPPPGFGNNKPGTPVPISPAQVDAAVGARIQAAQSMKSISLSDVIREAAPGVGLIAGGALLAGAFPSIYGGIGTGALSAGSGKAASWLGGGAGNAAAGSGAAGTSSWLGGGGTLAENAAGIGTAAGTPGALSTVENVASAAKDVATQNPAPVVEKSFNATTWDKFANSSPSLIAEALASNPSAEASVAARVAAGTATAAETAAATAAATTAGKSLSEWAKIALGAGAVIAAATENPDRTSSTKVEYPDWYNSASKSAIALADKYAALGPNSIAPLSANEKWAIRLAQTSAGDWQPLMDKSVSALDAAMPYYTKAGQSANSVKRYLDRSGALANEAAGGIPSIDLSAYMNPYLDNVLTPIARRNEIAKAATLADISAKAGMRGAFGGSRNDLLTNLATESADRNLNEAEANIRSGAFTTGLTAAQADLQRKLAASGQFGTLGNVANNTSTAYTNIGRSLTDTAGGYRSDAGALGTLTDADISRLTSTGGLSRGVEQAKLNAPLTAIGGYANALRGNPGSVTTNVAPEASKTGQVVGALTALAGANKAGWF